MTETNPDIKLLTTIFKQYLIIIGLGFLLCLTINYCILEVSRLKKQINKFNKFMVIINKEKLYNINFDDESNDNETDDIETDDNETDDTETDDNETNDNETNDNETNDTDTNDNTNMIDDNTNIIDDNTKINDDDNKKYDDVIIDNIDIIELENNDDVINQIIINDKPLIDYNGDEKIEICYKTCKIFKKFITKTKESLNKLDDNASNKTKINILIENINYANTKIQKIN